MCKTNPKSRDIRDTLKRKRLEKLFRQLDSDDDGLISNHKISIKTLDNQTISIITPLLLDIEKLNKPVHFEKFVKLFDKF